MFKVRVPESPLCIYSCFLSTYYVFDPKHLSSGFMVEREVLVLA